MSSPTQGSGPESALQGLGTTNSTFTPIVRPDGYVDFALAAFKGFNDVA